MKDLLEYYLKCIKLEHKPPCFEFKQKLNPFKSFEIDSLLLKNGNLQSVNYKDLIDFKKSVVNGDDKTWWIGFPFYYFQSSGKEYVTPLTYYYIEQFDAVQLIFDLDSLTLNDQISDYGLKYPDIKSVNEIIQISTDGNELEKYFNDFSIENNVNFCKNKVQLHSINFRGLLYYTERSNYTSGLEYELTKLKAKNDIKFTALDFIVKKPKNSKNDGVQIYDIFKLNNEQKKAVESAFINKVTVIEGPPGTGKSQVVASIIANGILNKKRVLFASKNNKAVTVVEEKVHSSFNLPVCLRVRSNDNKQVGILIDSLKEIIRLNGKNINNTTRLSRLEQEISRLKSVKDTIDIKFERYLVQSKTLDEMAVLIETWNIELSKYYFLKGRKIIERKFLLNPKIKLVFQYLNKIDNFKDEFQYLNIIEELDKTDIELVENSSEYFKELFLKIISTLTVNEIKTITDFLDLIDKLAKLRGDGAGRNLFLAEYYKKFKDMKFMANAWTIKNLSVNGGLPLDTNLFDILIIDEASQCDIASSLPLLYRAKNIVIVGDKYQLKHISRVPVDQSSNFFAAIGNKNQYMEYVGNSIFDLFNNSLNIEKIKLLEHYRSHHDIISFSNHTWYNNLKVHTDFRKLKPAFIDDVGIEFIDVDGEFQQIKGHGAKNNAEIKEVIKILKKVISSNAKVSVGIVTPFSHQKSSLRWEIEKLYPNDQLLISHDLIIDTAFGFQGDERDIMICSLVISDKPGDKLINTFSRFFEKQENQFNVALTRARAKLYVVGNKRVIRKYSEEKGIKSLNSLLDYIEGVGKHEKNNQTIIEKIFIEELIKRGLNPIPQFPINRYVLDIALIINDDQKLNIEIDGDSHLKSGFHKKEDFEMNRLNEDIVRDLHFKSLGWSVMRFWNFEIRDDLERCVNDVLKWIEN